MERGTSPSNPDKYILAVANGRNLQNLNAIHPTIAQKVESVVFTADIYCNRTTSYYSELYGHAYLDANTDRCCDICGLSVAVHGAGDCYASSPLEAPARALPYFVPINNANLFGSAQFGYPNNDETIWESIFDILASLVGGFDAVVTGNNKVPTLTDEVDKVAHADISGYNLDNSAENNVAKVYYLNINANKYPIAAADITRISTFYATGANHVVADDYYDFTGMFAYVNTTIDNLELVNPIVKGKAMTTDNNPCTGALFGAGGYNTLVTNCGVYIDTTDPNFSRASLTQAGYNADGDQTWYGVSGEGTVGGLVGYAKSHRTVKGELTNDSKHLAFSNCFAAVNVSGNMRESNLNPNGYYYGYSNGIGGFIGNSQLTNFYNCYASGHVIANNYRVVSNEIGSDWTTFLNLYHSGKESYGAGGFVGTSHGTRYTNCFATGDVTSNGYTGTRYPGAGGFVGIMSYDEDITYGHDSNVDVTVSQHTVFTNCYAVGLCNPGTNGQYRENFTGANARVKISMEGMSAYYTGDYYKILAPYRLMNGTVPAYQTRYIFKDSYYLNQYDDYETSQDNSNKCSNAASYDTLANLHTLYNDNQWIQSQIDNLKRMGLDATFFELFVQNLFTGNWEEVLRMLVGDKVFGMYFTLAERRGFDMNQIYMDAFTAGFQPHEWEAATAATSHSYALNAAGSIYPFSKLVGMDYYGDWPGKPLDAGLAYYEVYDDNTPGYYFDRDLTSTLKHEDVIVSDGYAILCSSKETQITVRINDGDPFTLTSSKYNIPMGSIDRPGSKVYYYAHLPAEKLQVASTTDFYTKIQVTISGKTYVMYYNPNVALTQVNPTNGNYATKPTAAPSQIYIRTARQFAALSTMENFWGEGYNYVQQLDIDADLYQWHTSQLEDDKLELKPIGSAEHPFNGTYTGNGGYVTKAELAGFVPGTAADNSVTGLFGVVGTTGKISALNISVEQPENAAITIESAAQNLGILAGVSQGSVDNVDINLANQVTLRTTEDGDTVSNAGLLAGLANGTISNCDITGSGAVTIQADNVGLAVGSAANITIRECSVSPTGDFVSKGQNVGGFAGMLTSAAVTDVDMTLKILRTEAAFAGGFAGQIVGGDMVSVNVNLTAETKNQQVPAEGEKAYLAGFAGKMDGNAAVADVFVDVGVLVSADNVSGLFGQVGRATVRNTNLDLTGGILNGTSGAAGAVMEAGEYSLFENMTLTVANGQIKASAGSAAGFAGEVRGQVLGIQILLGNSGQMSKIQGSQEAAGFACTISGQINSVSVRGIGEINSDTSAAGFAITVSGANGRVAASGVSTVVNDSAEGYLGQSNDNLTIKAPQAAGFLMNLQTENSSTTTAGIYNCYCLGKIVGANAYGFGGTVAGIVDGCTSNMTFADVSTNVCRAFVGTNNGTISNCYGWYGDGIYAGYELIEPVPTETNAETGEITLTDAGNYFSCYFVDTDMRTDEEETVTLIDINGAVERMTPDELGNSAMQKLNGTGNNNTYRWHTTGAYAAYPYSTFERPTYQYPMLRVHRGDWVTAPRYAYGIGYYEKQILNGETVWNLRIQDLSYFTYNVEDQVMNLEGVYDIEGNLIEGAELFTKDAVIEEAGYVVFVKVNKDGTYASPFTMNGETNIDIVGEPLTELPIALLDANANYGFYKLNVAGALTISSGDYPEASVNLVSYFADTMGKGEGPYAVRTIGQLGDIDKVRGVNLYQDHVDILCDAFPLVNDFTGTYDGLGYEISVTDTSTLWMNTLTGTIKNVKLDIDGDAQAVFGIVSGNVEDLIMDISGNLVKEPFMVVQGGTVDLKSIKANALNDNIFGIVQQGGSVGLETIDVTSIGASIVGTLSDSAVTQLNVNLPGQTLRVPLIETAATTEGATAIEGAVTAISGVTLNMAGAELPQGGLLVSSGNKVDFSNITITVPRITFTGDGDAETVDNFGILAGTLTGGTVTNVTVNPAQFTAPWGVVGGLVGNNDADITDVIVKDLTIRVTGEMDKQSIIGGIAGINTGDIGLTAEGKTDVDVDILYLQPVLAAEDPRDKATIGGLIGRMDDGVMGVANVLLQSSGSVALTNQEILAWEAWKARKEANPKLDEAEPAFTPADSARSYIIGGAVGRNDGASCIAVYTEVEVDTDWKYSLFVNGDVAEGIKEITSFDLNGPVGQFVGYVSSESSFDHCYGAGAADSLHFMGEVQYEGEQYLGENTYGGFDKPFAAGYIFNPKTAEEFAAFKAQYDVSDTYVAGYKVELEDCYYTNGGKIYKQEFTDAKYYYTGTDNVYDSYTTQLINDPLTFSGDANLTVTSFGKATTPTPTNWYYEKDGNYYQVWYQYSKAEFWGVTLGHGVTLWIDSNFDGEMESFGVDISPALDGGLFTPADRKIGVTLHTVPQIPINDGMYMIVNGTKHALASDGSAVDFLGEFTTEGGANQALVSAVWNKNGDKWSRNGAYLNLADAVVGAEKNIQITLVRGGSSNLVFSLNGGKYLIYRADTGTFSTGDRHLGLIHLYRVFVDHIYKMSFSNQLSSESLVSTEQEEMILPGSPAQTTAEDMEVTETTVSTESTEGTEPPVDSGEEQPAATEPPATEDGDTI